MAHPYSQHVEHHKSKARVHHILKHEDKGAKQHIDKGAFSRVDSKAGAVAHEHKVSGHKAPARFARGGKVKGHQTNIAIVVPHRSSPVGGPQAGAAPPPAAPAPPMGGPPMGGPPMPMGGPPPMRARGGKVASGIANADNIKKWGTRASEHSFARGGGLKMTAGAQSGVGRLEAAAHEKKKRK